MNKILFVAIALNVAFAAQIGSITGRCLNCIINLGAEQTDSIAHYCTHVDTCHTSDQDCSGYLVDDWIDCVDVSGYSLQTYCDVNGLYLSYLERIGNSTGTVANEEFCYLTVTNYIYEIDTDSTDTTTTLDDIEGVDAEFTLTELSEGLFAYWNADYTATVSDNFEEKVQGDMWVLQLFETGTLYIVNPSTAEGTYYVDAKNAVALVATISASLGALLLSAF